jgi:hypothetical protein
VTEVYLIKVTAEEEILSKIGHDIFFENVYGLMMLCFITFDLVSLRY